MLSKSQTSDRASPRVCVANDPINQGVYGNDNSVRQEGNYNR